MASTPAAKAPTADELAGQLGFAAAFFNAIPELKTLLANAIKGKWTPDKFKAEFMKTKWYRDNEASARQWAELKTRDPKTAESDLNARMAELRDQASQMGIKIDDSRLKQLAEQSIMFGFNPNELQDALAAEWTYASGQLSGSAAATEAAIEQLAYDYGVDVSDAQLADWIGGVLSGSYNMDTLTDYVKDMSRSAYQGMTSLIDAGMNIRQIASPYLQTYAQLMEVDPATVSLKDPTIARALQGAPNSQGQIESQSLYSFEKTLKKDPRWLKTKNAHQSMMDLGLRIGQDMGLYA